MMPARDLLCLLLLTGGLVGFFAWVQRRNRPLGTGSATVTLSAEVRRHTVRLRKPGRWAARAFAGCLLAGWAFAMLLADDLPARLGAVALLGLFGLSAADTMRRIRQAREDWRHLE
ncbi:hypothetical protein [Streptomyces sp. NPDC018045]|uniref:hypothetical protein n=1 Tax=Streptomyces sp. NPDC018045 TaxID=3365037 RepID=UPI003791DBCC